MFPGETILSSGRCACEQPLKLEVMHTCGWYVGTRCTSCGEPYSRETRYWDTRKEAQAWKDAARV